MTWLALAATGWMVGAGLAWAFIAASTRPEPFRPLLDLGELARCA